MGNVYANGMEISAKKDANKSMCAMPDVCLSPPSPPAGPVPIPYPNTAMASDTTDGSKTVKIAGQEVGLKNKSSYKKSNGDEAATKALGMGVVSHNIQGPMKFAAWSFDVKIEDENAIRHMDLTTHNHINNTNGAIVLSQAKQKIASGEPLSCEELDAINKENRDNDMRPSAKNTGFTSTTASFSPPGGGASTFSQAITRQDLIKSGRRNGYAKPRPPDQKMACTSEQWGAGGSNNHTEPKLLEQFFPAPGSGTLTMSISWKNAAGQVRPDACTRCHKGICTAIGCGLNILLCKEGKPEKPKCP